MWVPRFSGCQLFDGGASLGCWLKDATIVEELGCLPTLVRCAGPGSKAWLACEQSSGCLQRMAAEDCERFV